MPLGSLICRRGLDEERGNAWICECPLCNEARRNEENERLLHGDGVGSAFGVNPKTIYRRLWAKVIPAYKVGRIWRIAKKDIKWLRQ